MKQELIAVVPAEGLAVDALMAWVQELELKHGPKLKFKNLLTGELAVVTEGEACWCASCEDIFALKYEELTGRMASRLFIVCPSCGNKRCPRANFHDFVCTGSNEPGQTGTKTV